MITCRQISVHQGMWYQGRVNVLPILVGTASLMCNSKIPFDRVRIAIRKGERDSSQKNPEDDIHH